MALRYRVEAVVLLLIICVSNGLEIQKDAKPHHIKKRSLFQEGWMIECAQGWSSWLYWLYPHWTLTNYGDYGCYCGYGGYGVAVDNTDRCCEEHDKCWEVVKQYHDVSWTMIYFFPAYDYECSSRQITCGDPDGSWHRALCECDKTLALCLATHRNTYDKSYRAHDDC